MAVSSTVSVREGWMELRRLLPVVLREPFTRRTWAETAYALLSLPLAVVGFVYLVVSLVLGVALTLTLVGLPVLALGGVGARRLTSLNRALVRRLLRETVPAPPPLVAGPGALGWLQASLRDPAAWRARLYLLVKLPTAVATFYVTVFCWAEGLFLLTYPLWWRLSGPGRVPNNVALDVGAFFFGGGSRPPVQAAHQVTVHLDGGYADSWSRALLVSLAGLVTLLAGPWTVRGLAGLDRMLVRGLLGQSKRAARLRELEAARAQVVDDSAVRLRRIERDLHDGTQAQLVTLAMNLGQAKEKLEHRPGVPFDPAGALDLVDTAHRHAKEALLELRGIARGIHPPVLDVGLDAALATLVARSAVPALLTTDIPCRPDAAIETIAYFSAAELLANVSKHSHARLASVEVSVHDATLRLRVSDDGIGGAQAGAGSGLAGLAERASAVDGRMRVSSPAGGPTVVDVELPLRA